jgi:hypothetical protein
MREVRKQKGLRQVDLVRIVVFFGLKSLRADTRGEKLSVYSAKEDH